MNRPSLILVAGPALAGKSTLIQLLKHELPQLAVISSDDIRKELYGHYNYDPLNEPHTWQVIHTRINDLLEQGCSVILDSTLRTKVKRDEFRSRYLDKASIVCVAFSEVSLTVLLERNQKRSWKQFTPEVVTRLFHEYELPSNDEMQHYDAFTWIPFHYSNHDIEQLIKFLFLN